MSDYKPDLFHFAYFPEYETKLEFLAQIAEPEEWDFSDTSNKKYTILENYIKNTFNKLKSEQKIVYTKNNEYACFNTGLTTSLFEDIYALFTVNNNKMPENSPYFFVGFFKESDNNIIDKFSDKLPETANYFDKPEHLIFNPKYDIITQKEHIIQDNRERFPEHLKKNDENHLLRIIEGAISEVKKRVRRNYKLAVPQYYKGKIQLLLPLYLTDNSSNPDLALAISLINNNTYTARTCLTLKMAYNNARLIVKPQSNWLKP